MQQTERRTEPLVEIRLVPHGLSLYGYLSNSGDNHVAVRLLTTAKNEDLVRQGTVAEVLSVGDGAVFSAAACIAAIRGGEMVLALQQPPSPIQRRSAPRVTVETPVRYRAVRADGRSGAWLDAVSYDLSAGGMGLLVDSRAEIPRRLEVMFYLPTDVGSSRGSSRMYADDGSVILSATDDDRRHIRAVARTAHCRAAAEGQVKVGIAFSVLAPADRARLERYVAHHIAVG